MSVNTVHKTGPRFIQAGNIHSIGLPIKLFLCQPLAKSSTFEIVFPATKCACPCLMCRKKGMLYFYCCRNTFKEKPLCFPLRLIVMFCRKELHTWLQAKRQIFHRSYFTEWMSCVCLCARVCTRTCTHVATHTCERGYACASVHIEITGRLHVSVITFHLFWGQGLCFPAA